MVVLTSDPMAPEVASDMDSKSRPIFNSIDQIFQHAPMFIYVCVYYIYIHTHTERERGGGGGGRIEYVNVLGQAHEMENFDVEE